MKHLLLWWLFITTSVLLRAESPHPDTASAKVTQLFGYGVKQMRMNYLGDTAYETYLLVSSQAVSHDGVRLRVLHQDPDSESLNLVSDFICGHRRFVRQAIRKKMNFTIKQTEEYGVKSEWVVVTK